MKVPVRMLPILLLAALSLGLGGCATYTYTKQPDSATVRGDEPFSLIPHSQYIRIVFIDGQSVGPFWTASDHPEYVSPGNHEILVLGHYPSNAAADVEGRTVEANFLANHQYHFSINANFDMQLWDETDGVDKRVEVGEWVTSGLPFPDSGSMNDVDFVGTDYEGPPDIPAGHDGDDHRRHEPPGHPGGPDGGDKHGPPPSHPGGGDTHGGPPHTGGPGGGNTHGGPPPHSGGSGGPPSIPHEPRPGPSGGGGNSGGGHSSGGGGSSGGGSGSSGGGGHSGGGSGGGNSGSNDHSGGKKG